MNYSMSKAALLWGALFGFLAPIVGLFVGLQVSVIVANILLWPALLMSAILNAPLGNWSLGLMLTGMLVSIIIWSLTFGIVHMGIRRLRS
jgi:hypothetical protein